MDRQLPRLPRWSPNQAKRRLRASRALRFEASRWRWTRTRTGRRWLVGAVAVSLAAFMIGPWLLEGLARRDPGGPVAVLLVVAGLLVSWPVWVLSQLGLWFLLDQATVGVLRLDPGQLDERQQVVRDRAYRRAYRVVQVVLAVFLVAAWAGPRPVTFSGYRWQVVLTGLAWAALVLPTVVVAWTEPVDPDDSRLALAGPDR
jgi:hypothetical protein